MPASRSSWLVLALFVCLLSSCKDAKAQTSTTLASTVVRLDALNTQQGSYPAPLEVAVGLDAALTVREVATLPPGRFSAFVPGIKQQISIDKPLWLRMQIDAGQAPHSTWLLEFPTVIVDRYEVYQRDSSGTWQTATAGDRVEHTQWPMPSLRPRFPLSPSGAGVQEVYIRVVHQLPATIQPVIVDVTTAMQRDITNTLWAGMLVGLMSALMLICLQMTFTYRDWTYLWYAMYLLATAMAAVAYFGVAQKFLWPHATKFASDAVVYTVLMAFSFNLLFVKSMFGKWLGKGYRWIAMLLIAACVAYAVNTVFIVNYARVILLFIAITVAVCAFIVVTAFQAWRKGVPYSGYWLIVYVPYLLGIALAVSENSGQITLPWLPVNTPMLLAMAEAVAMMFCLNAYSRESHAQAVREQIAAQRDPLTGFLNESHFMDLASKGWRRAGRLGRDISVAYVLVESKEKDLSTVQFEALMMRSVRMVRTAMRESDGVGRIGRNMLGIVMPNVPPDEALDASLSRLIALGLMLDPRDSTAQAVKFTVAACSWRVNPESFDFIDKRLRELLINDDEERSRAIRFLSPE